MDLPKHEHKILDFWKKHNIFEKSIEQRDEDFVFYEGPPTANGKPGIHHVLSRAFKDIVCRYKAMDGYKVERKAGWDTHGLPVELEIEKELDLEVKNDIEEYGVGKFNRKCKESVWEYREVWEKMTERIGYWVDLDDPYITYDPDYMESVWQILKQMWNRDLLYKDSKVVPYCPRCGTALSSHEVAQGYQEIKDLSVYIKFKLEDAFDEASLLVWTTTPWTLPGNTAIAVNPDINYSLIETEGERLILASDRLDLVEDYEVIEKLKGKDLVGESYQPLFDVEQEEKMHQIWPAEFVSTDEGTGLVHIAPAFGEEDMELAKEHDLPSIVNVTPEGKFTEEVNRWGGCSVTDKDVNKEITDHLREKGKLFDEERYEHDYPFCWRCDSKLIYYSNPSYFVEMSSLKEELLNNNEDINWVPSHFKEGRFGEWLRNVQDWALSRERYWGTPLPVWECDECGEKKVIGSKEELLNQNYSSNHYYLLRHGQTDHQLKEKEAIYPDPGEEQPELTEKGRKQIEQVIPDLKEVDVIYASDLNRAKETAQIVAEKLKEDSSSRPPEVKYDKRLRDSDMGVWHGKSKEEFYQKFPRSKERFEQTPEEGESWNDTRARMMEVLEEIDSKNEGKNILIVGHMNPLWLLRGTMKGWSKKDFVKDGEKQERFDLGELRKMDYKKVPLNEEGEWDLHRPYVDEVEFECECGSVMKRTPEVIDCWFDSGSMPFAQAHWPFEEEGDEKPPKLFPADFISEAVDQTRGWFYTLLAISTALDFEAPYKNVVCLGYVLDKDGKEMSKSKGNTVKPKDMLEKYGADAVRWYLYTVNQAGKSKQFDEDELDQVVNRFLMTLWNSFNFYDTYVQEKVEPKLNDEKDYEDKTNYWLDKWIVSELNAATEEVTEHLDSYHITAAARRLEDFVVNKLSLWYIRRSRSRFQRPETDQEKKMAANVLSLVLLETAKLSAPFIPFLAEEIYQQLQATLDLQESVHLEDWPEAGEVDKGLNQQMSRVRDIVQKGLNARSDEGLKVRQPLEKLKVEGVGELKPELLDLIKGEINVKELELTEVQEKEGWKVKEGENLKVALKTEISGSLKKEGQVREIIRRIQSMRKEAGYEPKDKIVVRYTGDDLLETALQDEEEFVQDKLRAEQFRVGKKEGQVYDVEQEIEVDNRDLWLGIRKL